MNKKMMMELAHKMTREFVNLYGVDYRTQLGLCMKEVYRLYAETVEEMTEKEEPKNGYRIMEVVDGKTYLEIYAKTMQGRLYLAQSIVGHLYDDMHTTSCIVNHNEDRTVMVVYDDDIIDIDNSLFGHYDEVVV